VSSLLEERIRELCDRLAAAKDDAALDQIIPQLRAAIKEYVQDIRLRAAEVIPRTFRSDTNVASSTHSPVFCRGKTY
jgi:hypothetical protein